MHKYHSFMEYVQLYPEYDFIFIGDNGQGDAMCADRVIEKSGVYSKAAVHCDLNPAVSICTVLRAISSSVITSGNNVIERVMT